ncbi:hypothetical protein [Methanocella arvoryzae]|uniref:Uncharacterized protein n=1 Tax=Methanocella arvoryzae (strain DSM 22066 / NBRC 105507 / MRE50) TaxID=351160 RepID=Q0W322_METAR|nr:hypothetical protein [Methanocella arvoryzae]CAJ37221.1 hypothetical protein RCIX2081 [Methanocella arvoryzae MRE50]
MIKRFIPAGITTLMIMLILGLAVPSIGVASGHAAATPPTEPTTLGEVTVKTSPTIYFMLIGACILGCGGLLIFLRYR